MEMRCLPHNGSYMVARPLLTGQLGVPQKELREFFVKTLQEELADPPTCGRNWIQRRLSMSPRVWPSGMPMLPTTSRRRQLKLST